MSHLLESQNADERLDAPGGNPQSAIRNPQSDRPSGTQEWAASTLNVAQGCRHGCLYCYARFNALRFGQIATGADWACEKVHADRVAKGYQGGKGRVMMPSSHDITPETVDAVATVANKLLTAETPAGKPETRLLLVTKGDGPCVETVCRALLEPSAANDYNLDIWRSRDRVEWRLTIGCLDDRCRKFWEPHAPDIDMRLETLRWLYKAGWQTSVSCEPLLKPRRAVDLVMAIQPHVTETIWIGAARELRARTAWCRKALGERLEMAICNLELWQQPESIRNVAGALRIGLTPEAWAKIRFKDSYAEVLRGFGWQIENGQVLNAERAEASR